MIYTICNSALTACIDETGAQLISLKDKNGTEYIWQRDPAVWSSCSPLLFPIIGNLRNGKTVIDGKTYEIPKHGPVRSLSFHLKEQGNEFVALGVTDQDFPEGVYPYAFSFSITYSLSGESLSFSVKIENPAASPMAYCVGLHPAVCCPLFPGERFEDYEIRFPRPQQSGYRAFDLEHMQFDMTTERPCPGGGLHIPLNRELFCSDAMWFDRPSSREASLVHLKTGKGVRAEFPDFETIAFWTKPEDEARYLCFEPWNGSAPCSGEDDDFFHKNHLQKLSGGASRTYRLRLTVLHENPYV